MQMLETLCGNGNGVFLTRDVCRTIDATIQNAIDESVKRFASVNEKPEPTNDWLPLAQFAKRFGVCTNTIRKYARDGIVEIKPAGAKRFVRWANK